MSFSGKLVTKIVIFEKKKLYCICVMKHYAATKNHYRNISADMERCFWNIARYGEMHGILHMTCFKN